MGGYEVRNNITLTVTVCIAWFDVIGEPQRASCILGEEYVLTYVCFSKKKKLCASVAMKVGSMLEQFPSSFRSSLLYKSLKRFCIILVNLVMFSNHLQHCYALSGPDEILPLVWGPHLGFTNQVVYQTNQDKPSIHHSTCQARMLRPVL